MRKNKCLPILQAPFLTFLKLLTTTKRILHSKLLINICRNILIVSLQLIIKTIPSSIIFYVCDYPYIFPCPLVPVAILPDIFFAQVRIAQDVQHP